MLDLNLGSLNLGLLISLIPAVTLAFAMYQYRINSVNAQRQRVREQAIQAADEMDAFRHDKTAGLALRIVDYEGATIGVGPDRSIKVNIDGNTLICALEIHTDRAKRLNLPAAERTEKGDLFNDTERALRTIFDSLLVRLERIESLLRVGVVGRTQFGDLFSYWLKLLAEQPREEDMALIHFGDRRRKQLWKYIRRYEFNGVIRLFQMYGRAAPVGTEPDQAFRPKPRSGQPNVPDS